MFEQICFLILFIINNYINIYQFIYNEVDIYGNT
jgi:hypothetical protein